MNPRSFTYTPLLLPVKVARKPRGKKAAKPTRAAVRRHAIQEALHFFNEPPVREYVLKPSPTKPTPKSP